jgi:SAM-dependent methyltransferase
MLDSCPVCGSKAFSKLFSSPDRLHGVPGEYTYQKCGDCGSVFQNPMVIKDDLYLCYPSVYAPYSFEQTLPDIDFRSLPSEGAKQKLRKAIVDSVSGQTTSGAWGTLGSVLARSRTIRERAFFGLVIDECLPKGNGPHHALDLGCGAGWFMKKLQKVGWDVDGLEWNEDAAELARSRTGGQVWTGDFMAADLPSGKYELIVLNHVFEHFEDPKAVLRRVRELLSENGRVVLFFPNPNSLGGRYFGAEWFPWEVPRHLTLPSVDGMGRLATNAGFSANNTKARAYYSGVHWARSKAYAVGRHPENDPPALGAKERLGVLAESTMARLGLQTGWEMVSVLKK